MTNSPKYLCLDIETTGLDPNSCQIIEIAAVKFNEHEILESFQTFIHYDQPIPEIVVHLTGITQEMTKNAPTLEEKTAELLEFCQDHIIIGHNIQFDLNFLKSNNIPLKNISFDTLPLSQALIFDQNSYSLEILSKNFNQKYFPSHRAHDDCLANIELFQTLLQKIQQLDPTTQAYWRTILKNSTSIYSDLLSNLIPSITQPLSQTTPDPLQYLSVTSNKQTLPITKITKDITTIISEQPEKTLFVVSPATENKLDLTQLTKIYPENTQISLQKFQTFIDNNLNERETIALLKIATKINQKRPLYFDDLVFNADEFNVATHLTESDYKIVQTNQNYYINHLTFLKLNHKNLLPQFENIFFEDTTYLEETFIKAQEKTISLLNSSNHENQLGLSLAFKEISNYAKTVNPSETNYQYNPIFLDNLSFIDDTLQIQLNLILETTTNPSVKIDLQDLIKNFSNYLIWIKIHDSDLASLHYISKTLDTKNILPSITSSLPANTFYLVESPLQDLTLTINTPGDIPDPNDFNHNRQLSNFLLQQLSNLKSQAIIISTNNAQISFLHKSLATPLQELGITLLSQNQNGSKGKILENLTDLTKPTVLLCTQYFFLRNNPPMPNLEQLHLTKLPMVLPHHPYYTYLKNTDSNHFENLLIPHSALTITQILTQAKQENPNLIKFFLLDNRLIYKPWAQKITNYTPKSFDFSLIKN